MYITLYGVILRATIIIILINLKTIIRWMKNYDGWINDLTRTVVEMVWAVTDPPQPQPSEIFAPSIMTRPRRIENVYEPERTVVDVSSAVASTSQPQPSEHVFAPSIMTRPRRAETVYNPEEIADTMQSRRRSQQFDDTSADSDNFRYYLGPVLCCTQPSPPPVSDIIAANFCYPPPPLPEYYIGPAVFDIMGPPPMACCVAESKFSYPPPPLPWTRRSNANPPPSRPSPGGDQDRSNGPITRKSKIEPAVFDVMDPPPMGSCVTEYNILIPPPSFPWASEYKTYPPLSRPSPGGD